MSGSLTMVPLLVRLRWALTTAALRKSPWQVVGFVVACVFAAGCVIGAALGGGVLGMGVGPHDSSNYMDIMRIVMVLGGTAAILFIALLQAMYLGESSTMSTRKFALYGVPDNQLQLGLLAAALTGIPAITGLLSLLVWTLAYLPMGGAAVASALLCAPLAVLVAMCFSKMVLALAGLLVRSQRGKNIFYIVVMLLLVASSQIVNIGVNITGMDTNLLNRFTDTFGWLPLGTVFQLPFDAAAGNWLLWVARLAISLAFCLLCCWVCRWCITRERLQDDNETGVSKQHGIGAFSWMPDSASGAMSARLFSSLLRDARQSVLFLMPIVFLMIFAFEGRALDASQKVWGGSLLTSGLMMMICEANGIAYDGQGFAMQVIAGVNGRTDRKARVRVYLMIAAVYFVVLCIAAFLITGDWRTGKSLVMGLTFTALGFALALNCLGVSEWFSALFLYPVPSRQKPFSSPQGRGAAQAALPFLYLLLVVVCFLPAIVAIAAMAMYDVPGLFGWMCLVALANGIGILLLGTWWGGKLLDKRMLKVLHTLDDFAALQQ